MKGIDDCKRIQNESRNERLSEEGFMFQGVKSGTASLLSEVSLHKKNVVAV